MITINSGGSGTGFPPPNQYLLPRGPRSNFNNVEIPLIAKPSTIHLKGTRQPIADALAVWRMIIVSKGYY